MSLPSDLLDTPLLNVLILDGGGVRGLSSLLILKDLMMRINASLRQKGHPQAIEKDLSPHDIFRFVGGTSTGGLIAIMLSKLGMSVEDCIDSYHTLSRTLFKKKHFRGRITHGLAPTKYSGKRLRDCVRTLIHSKGYGVDLNMVCDNGEDKMACAVVCREHTSPSKYSDLKSSPVCICSIQCQNQLNYLACDAARATSAAPTFFPVAEINGRCFVDGGMEYNNPSQAIHYHYTEAIRARLTRTPSVSSEQLRAAASHDNLDFSRVRIINLGTGTKTKDLPERRRDKLARFVPGFIRMGMFLKRTLTEIAVNSEKTAESMKVAEYLAKGDLKYERFSADNGICYIKLDKYLELKEIQRLTLEYIDQQASQLDRVAKDIVDGLMKKHPLVVAIPPVDGFATIDPIGPLPETPQRDRTYESRPSNLSPASTDSSCDPSGTSSRQRTISTNTSCYQTESEGNGDISGKDIIAEVPTEATVCVA